MRCESDLKTLHPLLKLANILAISPPYINEIQPENCSKSYKLYTAGVLIVFISGYFCNLYGKFNDKVLKNFHTILNIIDFVANAFLVIASTSVIIIVVLWRSKKFKTILFTIEEFDSSVRLSCEKNRKFWMAYLAFQVVIVSTIFMDGYTWIRIFGCKVYMYFIPRDVMWYQFNVAIFLILMLALQIKARFRKINGLLVRCAKDQSRISSFLMPTLLQEYFLLNSKNTPFYVKVPDTILLRNIKFWYNDVVKLVEEFNSIFGLILLFAILFNIANTVNYTAVVMLHVIYKENRTDYETEVIATGLLWIAAAFLQTMLIAATCEGVTNEASRITEICYTLLSDIPSLPTTDYGVDLREELLLLAEQTAVIHPKVSAAGFFDVNLAMMGFVVASVTSYIIVVIQFM